MALHVSFSFCSGLINLIYCLTFDWNGKLIFFVSFVPCFPSLVLYIGVESLSTCIYSCEFQAHTCNDMSVTKCFHPWCTEYISVKWVINRLGNGFVPTQLNPSSLSKAHQRMHSEWKLANNSGVSIEQMPLQIQNAALQAFCIKWGLRLLYLHMHCKRYR